MDRSRWETPVGRLPGPGGSQVISKMKKICESNDALDGQTGMVVWNQGRKKQITDPVESLSKCF
jgi:hypothetical protein